MENDGTTGPRPRVQTDQLHHRGHPLCVLGSRPFFSVLACDPSCLEGQKLEANLGNLVRLS